MTLPPLPDLREAFEAYFANSRRGRGVKKIPVFKRLPDDSYADEPTQRHWWTWQNAARAAIAANVPEAGCGNIAAVPAQPVAWLYQTKSGFRKCWHAGEQSYPAFIADMAAASEFPETHSWTPLYAAPQAVPVPAVPVASVTECEACFTPDACQLRGKCDHYAAEQLRVAKRPDQLVQWGDWTLVPLNATEPMQKAMQVAVLLRKSMNEVWRAAMSEAPEKKP